LNFIKLTILVSKIVITNPNIKRSPNQVNKWRTRILPITTQKFIQTNLLKLSPKVKVILNLLFQGHILRSHCLGGTHPYTLRIPFPFNTGPLCLDLKKVSENKHEETEIN